MTRARRAPLRFRRVMSAVLAAAVCLVGALARAAGPPPAAPRPAAHRVVVLPYWNTTPGDLGALGEGIARALTRDTSKLAQLPRVAVVPTAEVDAAIQSGLSAAERDAFAQLVAKGDPEAALPLLTSVAKAANARLLVVGTLASVGGAASGGAQVQVETWLLARSEDGPLEEPVRHVFRAPRGRSAAELANQVGQDEWWTSAPELDWFTRLGTLHPDETQKRILNLTADAKKDRMSLVERVFPEEFLHAQTCNITPEQMRDATLATEQLTQRMEPTNPRSHNYRGLVEYCGKNEPQALRYFEKASALDASFPDAWYNAGWIYWSAYQLGHGADDLDRAFQSFSNAVEAEPGFAEARAKRGLAWLAKGDPRKAEVDLLAATREDRDNPDVLMGRCQLAVAAKRPDSANELCAAAVRADPKLVEARKILGDVARDRKLTAAAIEAYRAAYAQKPDFAEARVALIELFFQEKRYREARIEADAMIAAIPKHSVPHYWIGKICEDGDQHYACAEAAYQQALAMDRNWVTLRDDIARVRAKRGPDARPATAADIPAAAPLEPPSKPSAAARDGARGEPTRESYEEFLRRYNQSKKP